MLSNPHMSRPPLHAFPLDTFEAVVDDAQSGEKEAAAALVKQNTDPSTTAASLPSSPSAGNKLSCFVPEVCFSE